MAISRDHRRSLISGPVQTAISAGSSLIAVYYLVRQGGVELLGLWSIGNLAVLYGSAMALGVHQVVARDLAQDRREVALDGLTHYARLIWCLTFITVVGLLLVAAINPDARELALSTIILVVATGLWVLAILAKGPILYLRQFSNNNLVEAATAVAGLLATIGLVSVLGAAAWVVWLPFLVRSATLFGGLVLLMGNQREMVSAFLPALPNFSVLRDLGRRSYGVALLWLATSSRMVVLRTISGAFLGTAVLGLMDVATRVPVLLVNGVSAGNQTILVELSSAMRTADDSERVTQLLSGLARVIVLINLPLVALYCAYADIFLSVLVGTNIDTLRTLTWLAAAWVSVTAVNQLAYWTVQSAGKELPQSAAYILHTVFFTVGASVLIAAGQHSALAFLAVFSATGIILETAILWWVAGALAPFAAYVRSANFWRAAVGALMLFLGAVTASFAHNALENVVLSLLVPGMVVVVCWIVAALLILPNMDVHAILRRRPAAGE